jgi:hypothetical protein
MQGDHARHSRETRTRLGASAETERGQVRARGDALRRIQERLVFFEMTGPFNKEFFQMLEAGHRAPAGGPASAGTFANIVKVRGSLIMSAEAIEVYGHYVRSIRAAATAHVMGPEVLGRTTMVPLLARLYSEAGKSFGVFDDVPSAVSWAVAQLDASAHPA